MGGSDTVISSVMAAVTAVTISLSRHNVLNNSDVSHQRRGVR
jgi:hypothetical protein